MARYKEKAARRAWYASRSQKGFYNLREIFDHVNVRYLGGRVRARITWGIPRLARRSDLLFGTYTFEDRLITIHRVLDHETVPRFFLEFLMFHEMLHQLIPPLRVRREGRLVRIFHPEAFQIVERRFPYYYLAQAWERRHTPRLEAYVKNSRQSDSGLTCVQLHTRG